MDNSLLQSGGGFEGAWSSILSNSTPNEHHEPHEMAVTSIYRRILNGLIGISPYVCSEYQHQIAYMAVVLVCYPLLDHNHATKAARALYCGEALILRVSSKPTRLCLLIQYFGDKSNWRAGQVQSLCIRRGGGSCKAGYVVRVHDFQPRALVRKS